MYKLSPIKSRIKTYGYIVNAKTAHTNQGRIGYIINIKTTISVYFKNRYIPIYIQYIDKSKNTELYEWFVRHRRGPSPVLVTGKKRYQQLGRTNKMEYENSPEVLWVFLYSNTVKVTPLPEGIPEKYLDLKIK